MPLFLEEPGLPVGPTTVVEGSIAVELDWAWAAAWRGDFRRDHALLDHAYTVHPSLGDRIRSFWAPSELVSCGGSIELMVLADHGGLLYSLDAEAFLDALEELCATAPVDLSLGSETESDRAALLARLNRLRQSAQLRRAYVELVADLWSALAKDWEAYGQRAVKGALADRRELLRRGSSWRELAGPGGCSETLKNALVSALGPQGTIAIVPAFFAHLSSVVELPGTVLIGVRADNSAAELRARTEVLARRLKTMSDPTRLAMVESLRWRPQTVSELATTFSLAQPTVSTHVKLLREAGLVATQVDNGQRKLVLDLSAMSDLLHQLGSVLSAPDSD